MTPGSDLACGVAGRRGKLFGNPDWNGIDFIEVSEDQLSLCVHFFGRLPAGMTLANIRIEGGRRIRGIKAIALDIELSDDPELDDCLCITLDMPGDFSSYRLCLVEKSAAQDGEGDAWQAMAGIDPHYACACFSFKADCPSDLDCRQDQDCPAPLSESPEINYLAKDFASFRQLIYDRLALTMPEWRERRVPDLGVTLVELLAYAADHLSYYQDAVATEAYLGTARRRISVRRHARLVDYRMHEGSNARAWVTVCTQTDLAPMAASNLYFITGFPDLKTSSGNIVRQADLDGVPPGQYQVFEPVVADPATLFHFRSAHCEIPFYTWGGHECCLAQGATRATLLDQRAVPEPVANAAAQAPSRVLDLHAGDVLIFEEVFGAATGNAADADPAHRHAVRLTRVTPSTDGLLGVLIVEIEWAPQDALPFPLCLSVRLAAPDCGRKDGISVARGNVVLVDHGRSYCEPLGPVPATPLTDECACDGSVIESRTAATRFRPSLEQAPLTFSQPRPAQGSASALIEQDPRLALPVVSLRATAAADAPAWQARYDLLSSGSDEAHFVAEVDDDGRAHLRFGDGNQGRTPDAGVTFQACYRAGNGPVGNVGSDTINYLVLRKGSLSADHVAARNPLPARGGTAPEPVTEVKLFAPGAFRTRRERAISADDYAELAQKTPGVSRAAAELRWMGSWYEMRVALDPLGSEILDPALQREAEAGLAAYRRIGHDVAVVAARYVPIALAMEVCVLPHHARGAVKAELLRAFGSRRRADGKPGFFNPDNFSFGDGVYVSRLIAAARAVPGVETVRLLKLARLHAPEPVEVPASGVLPMTAREIAQLDNDPNWPENGTLELVLRGGL